MRAKVVLFALAVVIVAAAQDGARYLIITADQFASSIQPLAEWKHASGMKCRVARLSETGPTLSEIRDYILNAYNNWPIPPEFVLLVGHSTYLPSASYGTGHGRYYSDNYFADLSGDLQAELPVGRFPVRSTAQCEVMVAKTLSYEKDPYLADSLWMRRLTTIAREDYDPDDSIYWSDVRFAASLAGAAGFVSCDSFSRARGHSSANVINSVNNGTGLVLYRGTGTNNWAEPFNTHPEYTTNGFKLPIVLSITCATMALDPYDSMVGSAWVKAGTAASPRGAVAFFGNTHSASNVAQVRSAVARGFFTGLFTEQKFQLGQSMLRAKKQLYQEYPQYTSDYRGFNLYGDPELRVWTATPKPLTVSHPAQILPQPQELNVTVLHQGQPVANALVCASMDSTVYEYAQTSELGTVQLSISPADTGWLRLVVTGRNLLAYDGLIEVTYQVGLSGSTGRPEPAGILFSAWPTAFRTTTRLQVSAPGISDWQVLVYDGLGRPVQTLGPGGNGYLTWDGSCEDGSGLPAGVYFCTLISQGRTLAQTRVTKLD